MVILLVTFTSKMVNLRLKFIWWIRYLIEFGFKKHEEIIKKELGSIEGKILDLGCGIGNFSPLFAEKQYYGIDIDDNVISYAKTHYKGNFSVADARKSGFPKDYFQAVLAIGLLHHLIDSDVAAVAKEIQRIVKPGGRVVVIEDVRPAFWQNPFINLLYRLDAGGRFRSSGFYKKIFKRYFYLKKSYPVKSGFWRYNVFVFSLNRVC